MKYTLIFVFIGFLKLNAQFSSSLSGGINRSILLTNLFTEPYGTIHGDHLHYSTLYQFGIGVKYNLRRFNINSGAFISERGAIEKGLHSPPGSEGEVDIYYAYFTIPIHLSKFAVRDVLEYGFGLNVTYIMSESLTIIGVEDEPIGMDIEAFIRYYFLKRFSLKASYLLGGVDKYIGNKTDNYMHSVFGLSLSWDFIKLKRKS